MRDLIRFTAGCLLSVLAVTCFVSNGQIQLGIALVAAALYTFHRHICELRFESLLSEAKNAQSQRNPPELWEILAQLNRRDIRQVNRELCLFDTAITNGWVSVGKLLLKHCPLPDITLNGNTPLHILCAFGTDVTEFNSVRLLSADINARNGSGQTPRDVALLFDQEAWLIELKVRHAKNAFELDYAKKAQES